MKKFNRILAPFLLILSMMLSGCGGDVGGSQTEEPAKSSDMQEASAAHQDVKESETTPQEPAISLADIPDYTGDAAYVVINGNIPDFKDSDMVTDSFETYSELDSLGRCGVAYANVGTDLMPTEKRGSIGQVKPTGWHTVEYDNVDGNHLYNRCHLIGYQLTAENANEKNLITGTRYMNVDGMLPFENMVADYVKETNNHVLYRVSPIFEGDNLVASGVQMEAMSVEDGGEGILFNVFCFNVQPDITIDYRTGESSLGSKGTENVLPAGQAQDNTGNETGIESTEETYILNTNTMKFHYPACGDAEKMKDANKKEYIGNREDLVNQGYAPCKRCNP